MPTGYTAPIEDGISFDKFVWRCARAMGALIMMRDDRMDALPPERFEPSDYHAKQVAEIEIELEQLATMTDGEASERAAAERNKHSVESAESKAKRDRLKANYQEMLAKVNAWSPPSVDHVGLKRFMADQIAESIRFDCEGLDEFYKELPVVTGATWLAERRTKLRDNLEYHKKHHAEEVQRTEDRNQWLDQLRTSVPQPSSL